MYDALAATAPSPIVELNRAIAVGMRHGPEVGLAVLDPLAPMLRGFRLLPAARADMVARPGRTQEAADRYRQALAPPSHRPNARRWCAGSPDWPSHDQAHACWLSWLYRRQRRTGSPPSPSCLECTRE